MADIPVSLGLDKASEKRLRFLTAALGRQKLGKAVSMAIGDASRSGRTVAAKEIRRLKAYRYGYVLQQIKARWNKSGGSIHVDGHPIPVASLGYTVTKRGIRFRLAKGKSTMVKGAFVATMASGHAGPFVRVSSNSKRNAPQRIRYKKMGVRNTKQLPIKELFAPGISSGLKSDASKTKVTSGMSDVFNATLMRVSAAMLEGKL